LSDKTGIGWTDATWNPVIGCTKVSQGCKLCYAKTLHDQRHKAYLAGKKIPAQYARSFEYIQVISERLTDPYRWRKPRRIFVNSMSDLFHEDLPFRYIAEVFTAMWQNPRHTFQVLTKRPGRLLEFYSWNYPPAMAAAEARADWLGSGPNIWLGTSTENQETADQRIPLLKETPAAIRFLSCEPLLGPIDILRHIGTDRERKIPGQGIWIPPAIGWVIIGGETGLGHRVMRIEWLEQIVEDCRAAGVPVFVKQDSGGLPGGKGRIPDRLWIQRFPGQAVAA